MADGGTSDELPESLRLHAFAALAGRLEADHRELVDFLGGALARALPGAVTVHRRGLLPSSGLSSVEVLLGRASTSCMSATAGWTRWWPRWSGVW